VKRREFLRVIGGAGFAACGLLTQSGCAPSVVEPDPSTGLSLGYVAGEVTPDSALIWLRAEPQSKVAIQYTTHAGFGEFLSTAAHPVDAAADSTVNILLAGLRPSTRYYYRARVAGRAPGAIASFVTAPRPNDSAKVVFCFSGDTRESYRPFSVMEAVRRQRPDFFLHLGDTIYADRNGRARRPEEFWAKYRSNRSDAATQQCFGETCVYATWDDHEVANDYLPAHPLAPIGQKAFLDYWPVLRVSSERGRIYRSFRWGKAAELFILDTRQYRDLRIGSMLGENQKKWLFDGLARSSALFKFVATPVPMAGGGRDRWDGYPREREEILRFINDKKLPGVVFLSADLHYAAITKIPNGGGLRDITAGPLGAPLNRVSNGAARRYEFFLAENFNFAKVTVDPKHNSGTALVEFIDQDNRVFHGAKISAK
jgi:alkaline phosphatase D